MEEQEHREAEPQTESDGQNVEYPAEDEREEIAEQRDRAEGDGD